MEVNKLGRELVSQPGMRECAILTTAMLRYKDTFATHPHAKKKNTQTAHKQTRVTSRA